ncbi:MAG: prepilin-type N-terminal cleavage/methylation domain-containing protein [Planctomycetales bacterium]
MQASRRGPSPRRPARRSGFTLIELLVVVVIIAALAAFVVPAVMGAVHRARITEAVSDIKNLESGISAFELKYGVEPPSSIVLDETGTAWDAASRAKIRRIWPSFDFSAANDIDGDSGATEQLTLNGAECLVFFLGGISDAQGNLTGFSANPQQPFAPGGNRVGPFIDNFDRSRLRDVNGNHMREYVDTLAGQTMPYLYASSYDGRGYEPADLNLGAGAPMTDVYRQPGGTTAWNSKGFQIISPGYDAQYGSGGPFDPDTADSVLNGPRSVERDNLTNFHSGELSP